MAGQISRRAAARMELGRQMKALFDDQVTTLTSELDAMSIGNISELPKRFKRKERRQRQRQKKLDSRKQCSRMSFKYCWAIIDGGLKALDEHCDDCRFHKMNHSSLEAIINSCSGLSYLKESLERYKRTYRSTLSRIPILIVEPVKSQQTSPIDEMSERLQNLAFENTETTENE